jgi:mRNA interferase RelE/StbE
VSHYRVEVRPAAVRALRNLDRSIRPRIEGAIALLAEDPRPPASRPLRVRGGYRVRVGDYRIVYTIQDDMLLVVMVTLGHDARCTDSAERSAGRAGPLDSRRSESAGAFTRRRPKE